MTDRRDLEALGIPEEAVASERPVMDLSESQKSEGEEDLALVFRAMGWNVQREYRGIPGRQFKFDFAVPGWMLAVEVEGGVWTQGRHTRGSGFLRDIEKYNLAAIHGWTLLRFSTQQCADGTARETLETWYKFARERFEERTGHQ